MERKKVFHISKEFKKNFSTAKNFFQNVWSKKSKGFPQKRHDSLSSVRQWRQGPDMHFSTVFLWKSGKRCGKMLIIFHSFRQFCSKLVENAPQSRCGQSAKTGALADRVQRTGLRFFSASDDPRRRPVLAADDMTNNRRSC